MAADHPTALMRVDNVKIKEPLGSSDHNQMHFDLNIKSDRTKVKVADLQSYNFKIYQSLPKTYNSIRMTIHHLFKRQLFLHKLCKLLLKMAANGKNIWIFSNNIFSEACIIMM